MNCQKVSEHIIGWLIKQEENARAKGFVVGVSGGVDSGLVSTLCAKTGKPTLCLSMPIHQAKDQVDRATMHMVWLGQQFENVDGKTIDLTDAFEATQKSFDEKSELSLANTRSRLRMVTLYNYASVRLALVAGTGNMVEDYGVGFFTKYGDGGVDLSPIGDLLKSEVRELASYLGVSDLIVKAVPTDGLWADGRGDESAIGATYDELEWAMNFCNKNEEFWIEASIEEVVRRIVVTDRQKELVKIYLKRHRKNAHKMEMPPVCDLTGVK